MRRLVILLCACRSEPITSCTDDLAGTYRAESGSWNILDNRHNLEAYPMFDDTKQTIAGLEIAPRVIDLTRGDSLAGQVTRRYMKGSLRCDAKAPAHVTSCKDNTLEIVLGDPVPPISFSPCTFGQTAGTHRERWVHE
jgi:hypothetical protein